MSGPRTPRFTEETESQDEVDGKVLDTEGCELRTCAAVEHGVDDEDGD